MGWISMNNLGHNKTIMIFGGSGNTGRKIAKLLLLYTECNVIIAARNIEPLEKIATALDNPNRLFCHPCDAILPETFLDKLPNVDLVVSASPTSLFTEEMVNACLKNGCDYIDLQYSGSKGHVMKSMASLLNNSSQLFITDAGFHPGLPAALVRFAARQMDEIHTAKVSSAINMDWFHLDLSEATEREFVRELLETDLSYFSHGEWQHPGMLAAPFSDVEFGEPIGKRKVMSMFMEELRTLPEQYQTLEKVGFFITGFGWLSDYIVMPLSMLAMKISPYYFEKMASAALIKSFEVSSHPPYYTALKLEATGIKDGKEIKLEQRFFHEDGYWFTAIPVVACLLQYFRGELPKSGLHWMGQIVKPENLMDDMEKMGIELS